MCWKLTAASPSGTKSNPATGCNSWVRGQAQKTNARSLLVTHLRRSYRLLADRFDSRGLARQFPQIIEACTPYLTAAQHLDSFQPWRMQREDTLNADTIGDLPHCKGGPVATPIDLDNDALEWLNPFFFPFNHS